MGTYHANRLLSAMCFSFYCFRFVQLFEINDQIGPKVFMLKKMAIDLFFFLFLLLVNLMKPPRCIQSDPDLVPPDLVTPRFSDMINFPRYRKLAVFDPDLVATPI
eukprot:sb/3477886/